MVAAEHLLIQAVACLTSFGNNALLPCVNEILAQFSAGVVEQLLLMLSLQHGVAPFLLGLVFELSAQPDRISELGLLVGDSYLFL